MGLIIEIIFLLLVIVTIIANIYVRETFKRTSKIENAKNITGFEVTKELITEFCPKEPHIIKKNGKFLDFYDLERNVIKLSPTTFDDISLYANIMGYLTALEAIKPQIAKNNKINVFLILFSYLTIAIGAILNNFHIIHVGIIIFILAFIYRIYIINMISKLSKDRLAYNLLKRKKLMKPEALEINLLPVLTIYIARLPYDFINYFR